MTVRRLGTVTLGYSSIDYTASTVLSVSREVFLAFANELLPLRRSRCWETIVRPKILVKIKA